MDAAAIQVVLANGDPKGIIYAGMHDWAGRIAIFPRDDIEELVKNPDYSCPALYILIGEDQSNFGQESVYVGETEVANTRIKQHLSAQDKTFWKRAIILTSASGGLNKAHIKSLESIILKELDSAKAVSIKNQNKFLAYPHLAMHDEIIVSRYFKNYKVILRSLGYKIFEMRESLGFRDDSSETPTILNYSNPIFEIKSVGVTAHGRMLGDSFVVSKGSTIRHIEGGSHAYFAQQLIDSKLVTPLGNSFYIFQRDVAFSSPSLAASVVTGTTRSGWSNWKVLGTNITMRAWKDEMDQIFGFDMQYPMHALS